MDACDERDLLTRANTAWERPAITAFVSNNPRIHSERWRCIQYDHGSEELYDHRKDADDRINLAANLEYRGLIEELVS